MAVRFHRSGSVFFSIDSHEDQSDSGLSRFRVFAVFCGLGGGGGGAPDRAVTMKHGHADELLNDESLGGTLCHRHPNQSHRDYPGRLCLSRVPRRRACIVFSPLVRGLGRLLAPDAFDGLSHGSRGFPGDEPACPCVSLSPSASVFVARSRPVPRLRADLAPSEPSSLVGPCRPRGVV